MRSTLRVNLGAGIGSISSRFSRLRITATTLLMNPIMSILSHHLQCIHPREYVIFQDTRHLILIQGPRCAMPMLKSLSTSDHFRMSMCRGICLLEKLLWSSNSFVLLFFNNLLLSSNSFLLLFFDYLLFSFLHCPPNPIIWR